jgi:uncharacterized SAM-binding protein YcdF (DUF218 family)
MYPTINNEILRLAKVLWDYHYLDLGLRPVDFILALGSHDERVAEYAAELALKNVAPILITSGGFGKVTGQIWGVSEGERFAKIARELGVPESRILVEETATNTGDNITKTRELLRNRHIDAKSAVLVTKPYMRRRAYATATKQWAGISWLVSSPSLSFDSYPDVEVPQSRMIELMVGDLQRIKVYADQGFQTAQDIPTDVWQCYEELVSYGFDRFVIKSET